MSNNPFSDDYNNEFNSHYKTLFSDTSTAKAIEEKLSKDDRYDEGHDVGYTEGHTAGSAEGHTAGYGEGFTAGKEEGVSEGVATGHADGYTEGHNVGYQLGYTNGYTQSSVDSGNGCPTPVVANLDQCIAGNSCYDLGFDAGHASGYSEGNTDGIASVYQSRYDQGLADGTSQGYADGYATGLDEGKGVGQTSGQASGYQNGFIDGQKKLGAFPEGLTTLPDRYTYLRSLLPSNLKPTLSKGDKVLDAASKQVFEYFDPINLEIAEGTNLSILNSHRFDGYFSSGIYKHFKTFTPSFSDNDTMSFPFDPTYPAVQNRSAIAKGISGLVDKTDVYWLCEDHLDAMQSYFTQLNTNGVEIKSIFEAGDTLENIGAQDIKSRIESVKSNATNINQVLVIGLPAGYTQANPIPALRNTLELIKDIVTPRIVLLNLEGNNLSHTGEAKTKASALTEVQYIDTSYINVHNFFSTYDIAYLPVRISSFILNELLDSNSLIGIQIGRTNYYNSASELASVHSGNMFGNDSLTYYKASDLNNNGASFSIIKNTKLSGISVQTSNVNDYVMNIHLDNAIPEIYLNIGNPESYAGAIYGVGSTYQPLSLTPAQVSGVDPVSLSGQDTIIISLTSSSQITSTAREDKIKRLTLNEQSIQRKLGFEEEPLEIVNGNIVNYQATPNQFWTRFITITPNLWIRYNGKYKPIVKDSDGNFPIIYEEGGYYYFKPLGKQITLRIANTATEYSSLVDTISQMPTLQYASNDTYPEEVFSNFTPKFRY